MRVAKEQENHAKNISMSANIKNELESFKLYESEDML